MPLNLINKHADVYVPDGTAMEEALGRTTHLCIGAHPDDIEINCYPAVSECFGKPDRWFTGITVTNGSGCAREGVYADYSDKQMAVVRRREQRKAAVLGEYSVQFQLDYASSELKNSASAIEDLSQILKSSQPEKVYLHNPADKHDTHVVVFMIGLAAIRSLPVEMRPRHTYAFEGWRNLDWLCDADKVGLDASLYPNLAAALTGLYDSQISGGKRYDLAIAGRRQANATFYDAHKADKSEALTWAIDLNPLVEEEHLSVEDFIGDLMDSFHQDVLQRIRKFL